MSRPSPSPDFEPRIADWLEDDPDNAPDVVLATVLAAFPSIPQQHASRVPWRFRPMTQTTRLLAGAAAIAVVLIGGVLLLRPGGGTGPAAQPPSSAPSTSPAATGASPSGTARAPLALTETFRSSRYAYSVKYPTGWTTTPATKTWTTLQQNLWGSGYNDELKGTDIRFSGTSIPLAKGQTADQWLAAYAAGGDVGSWPTVTIFGQQGKIDYDGGPAGGGTIAPGGVMFDSVVVVGNRAYNFNMDGRVDRATFEAFLENVTLDLASSVSLTQDYTSGRHGFSIKLPASWNVTPATKAWPAGTDAAAPPDPMLDMFADPADSSLTFAVVSQPLAAGVTSAQWLATYEASAPSMPGACWPPPDQMEQVTVGGQSAWVHGGLAACGFTEAVVFAGGRIYEFSGYVPAGGTPMSRALFDTILATVTLNPSAANDKR
jgi:hypothetical protein